MSILKHIIALVILVVLLGLVYSFTNPSSTTPTIPDRPDGDQIACTMEAMMCPDGTYVGRSGPNCQFVCPVTSTSTAPQAVDLKITMALNESKIVEGTTITVWAVTEDSRCPSDVQCIQAGRVRVALHFATSSGDSIVEVEIGKTVTTETLSITLDEVTPYPVSTRKIADGDYKFVLSVKGK